MERLQPHGFDMFISNPPLWCRRNQRAAIGSQDGDTQLCASVVVDKVSDDMRVQCRAPPNAEHRRRPGVRPAVTLLRPVSRPLSPVTKDGKERLSGLVSPVTGTQSGMPIFKGILDCVHRSSFLWTLCIRRSTAEHRRMPRMPSAVPQR